MSATCYKCKKEPVIEEFTRCVLCEREHQELIKELVKALDSRPRVKEKKVKEKLYPIKEMKGGIPVTTWISKSDAAIIGIKIE